ncbi:uracil-DNA glycosylase [Euzebya sp.]|uniref:uracil-DNA glycosylase n=1 Tax=Euzebya sp. TaxID=1971409 RepID=UPI003517C7E0
MAPKPLSEVVGPGWELALEPVADEIGRMGEFLRGELAAGRQFLPAPDRVFAAFQIPFEEVRVLVLGQDPYPTPGHAMGLSFSVWPDVQPVPRSLDNIFREYCDDLGLPRPATGDLSPWTHQGVMLLNRCLSVAPRSPGSHRGKGWEAITEQAIRALSMRNAPLVGVLWGRDARDTREWLLDAPAVESAHPSPMSASRGFFGSKPFSRVNAHLASLGADPVDWTLPS